MKNKGLMIALFLVFALFLVGNSSAAINDTKVNKAYSCLQNKTQSCSTSLDDNIFTLLSLKTCSQAVSNASSPSTQCWPKSSCNVKQTSMALWALSEAGASTSSGIDWLLSQQASPTNIDWFLQIETASAATCTVKYSGYTSSVNIAEDKKISTNAVACLTVSENGYWLKVASSPQCQQYDYEISCDKDFMTSKLFKEQSSDVIHVTSNLYSSSPGGTTTEKINSSCFSDLNSCSYEGTLWAALLLKSKDYDVSSYLPYIITMAESNSRYLPEAFLYILAGDSYKADLLVKQKSSKYWEESGERFYDTALALLALQPANDIQKTSSIDWLMDSQDSQGCWQGSVKDTGFILYSIAPRAASSSGTGTSKPDCESNGFFCMSSIGCSNAGGKTLDNYQCASGLLRCCDSPPQTFTCAEKGGIICSTGQTCAGGTSISSSDSGIGTCCLGGSCIAPDNGGSSGDEQNACEIGGGTCRSVNCESGETSDSTLGCDFSSQNCCVKTKSSSSSLWWIWVLLAFVVILALGIIFREKLREFWFRIKSGFKPRSPPSHPGGSQFMHMPMIPRRILPARHTGPAPARRSSGELDDVLKKLRDMSK